MNTNHEIFNSSAHLFFCSLRGVTAQDSLDCDTKYQQWEQFFNENATKTFMEKAPVLKGGLEALQKQVVYPKSGAQIYVDGRVFVQLIVSEKGSPQCIRIAKGLQQDFDQAAKKAVSKMEFEPATVQDEPIEVPYTLLSNSKFNN